MSRNNKTTVWIEKDTIRKMMKIKAELERELQINIPMESVLNEVLKNQRLTGWEMDLLEKLKRKKNNGNRL